VQRERKEGEGTPSAVESCGESEPAIIAKGKIGEGLCLIVTQKRKIKIREDRLAPKLKSLTGKKSDTKY